MTYIYYTAYALYILVGMFYFYSNKNMKDISGKLFSASVAAIIVWQPSKDEIQLFSLFPVFVFISHMSESIILNKIKKQT